MIFLIIGGSISGNRISGCNDCISCLWLWVSISVIGMFSSMYSIVLVVVVFMFNSRVV